MVVFITMALVSMVVSAIITIISWLLLITFIPKLRCSLWKWPLLVFMFLAIAALIFYIFIESVDD